MKKVLLLVSCACLCFSCVTIVSGATSDEVSSSRKRTRRSSKSSVAPEPTINDFKEYYEDVFRSSFICYWKDSEGNYMCLLSTWSNLPPSMDRIQDLQTNLPCPVSLMKEIIAKAYADHGFGNPQNEIYEISAPFGELEWRDFASSYRSIPTRNREIYTLLGLESVYERYYGDSKQVYYKHDGFFKDEKNPMFHILPKHFTNLSHIYRWVEEGGEYRYAFVPQRDNEVGSFYCINNVQDYMNFTAAGMKKVVEAYYSVTNVDMDNLVVDIPLLTAPRNWAEDVRDKFPDSVSRDISVYRELGLEESYRRHFGS